MSTTGVPPDDVVFLPRSVLCTTGDDLAIVPAVLPSETKTYLLKLEP